MIRGHSRHSYRFPATNANSATLFAVKSAAGTSYSTTRNVLSAAGTSYAVSATVLSANGTSYTPI